MSERRYFKCLMDHGRSVYNMANDDQKTVSYWDLPKNGKPGEWRPEVYGELRPDRWGYHLATEDFVIGWFSKHNFLAQADEDKVEREDLIVTRKARLLKYLPVNDQKWADMALSWAGEVVNSFEFMRYPRRSHQQIVEAYQQAKESIESGHISEQFNESSGVAMYHAMANERYERNSYESSKCCAAAARAAKAIGLLGYLSLNGKKAVPSDLENWKIAKEVAYAVVQSIDEGIQYLIQQHIKTGEKFELPEMYDKWLVNLPHEKKFLPANLQAVYGIRRKQNNDLLRAFGLK